MIFSQMGKLTVGVIAMTVVLTGCSGTETAGDLVEVSPTAVSAIAPEVTDMQEVDPALITAANLDPCPEGVFAPDAAIPGLPTLTLNCLDGTTALDLSTARGVPMVVNVWASWCPPCIAEMPLLARAANDLADQVQFLGINIEDDRSSALQLLAEIGVTFPSVEDRGGDTRAPLTIPGPPVTYFVRADGVITGRWDGQIQGEEQLSGFLQEYLGITW